MPSEVEWLPSGDVLACFAGTPLLRFPTMDALLEKFDIEPGELVEVGDC